MRNMSYMSAIAAMELCSIFLHFVCIILCEIFILTLLCHTYFFLYFVCIIHFINVGVNIGVNMV